MIKIQMPGGVNALGHNGTNFIAFSIQNNQNVQIRKFDVNINPEIIYQRRFQERIHNSVFTVEPNEQGQIFLNTGRKFIVNKDNICKCSQLDSGKYQQYGSQTVISYSEIYRTNRYIILRKTHSAIDLCELFRVLFKTSIPTTSTNDIIIFELETKKLQVFTLPEPIRYVMVNPEENVLAAAYYGLVYIIDLE